MGRASDRRCYYDDAEQFLRGARHFSLRRVECSCGTEEVKYLRTERKEPGVSLAASRFRGFLCDTEDMLNQDPSMFP